jgi:hypothetical protein
MGQSDPGRIEVDQLDTPSISLSRHRVESILPRTKILGREQVEIEDYALSFLRSPLPNLLRLLSAFINFCPGADTRKMQTKDMHTNNRSINVSVRISTTFVSRIRPVYLGGKPPIRQSQP